MTLIEIVIDMEVKLIMIVMNVIVVIARKMLVVMAIIMSVTIVKDKNNKNKYDNDSGNFLKMCK